MIVYVSIDGDFLLWAEVYAGVAILALLFARILIPRLPIALVSLVIVVVLTALSGFRPPEYNSDTMHYFSYVSALSFLPIEKALFFSKLEPVHAILAAVLENFRFWLVSESAIAITGLVLSYRARVNDVSFVTLCAFVITLGTSSLRYVVALIYFMYFVFISRDRISNAIRMTIILCCFHISMLLSGMLALRRTISPLAISAVCLLLLYRIRLLGSYINQDELDPSHGFKTLAVLVGIMLYYVVRSPRRITTYHLLFAVSSLLLFLIGAFFVPVFNRFLIMSSLVLLSNEWRVFRGDARADALDRIFLFALCGMIVGPYVHALPTIYFNGTW